MLKKLFSTVLADMRNETLIEMGRKDIKDTDEALERARRVVEDTIQIGAQVCRMAGAASSPLWAKREDFRFIVAHALAQFSAILNAFPLTRQRRR